MINPDAPGIADDAFHPPIARPLQFGLLRQRIEARHGLQDIELLRRAVANQAADALRFNNEKQP